MERTFWIQGRTGRYWQNLESLDSDQAAIVRLGALITEDRYDELRLVQAEVSAISGETHYTNVVTVRNGQVVDSPMLRAEAAANNGLVGDVAAEQNAPTPGDLTAGQGDDTAPDAGESDSDSFDPDNHPQLRFWPTAKPEHMQGQLGLGGEKNWHPSAEGLLSSGEDAPQDQTETTDSATEAGAPERKNTRRSAKFVPHVTVHSAPMDDEILAGGWRIPKADSEDAVYPELPGEFAPPPMAGIAKQPEHPDTGIAENNTVGDDATLPKSKPGKPAGQDMPVLRDSLTADPDSRGDNTRRHRGRKSPRAPGAKPRRSAARQKTERSGSGRVALMSGVFAGALATGLALSAINPDFAGRFFAGVSGQVGDFLPTTGLIEAIEKGDLQSVRARLAEGVDPNSLDLEKNPALLRATRAGNLAAVSLLLQAGADPTLPTQDGRSVLHRAAAEGRGQALARMIDAGAPVDLAGGVYGCLTPLAVAAANGRVRAASLLAERGGSLGPQNGCTIGPMEIAAAHPHVLARLEQLRAERDAVLQLAGGSQNENTGVTPRPGTALITATPDATSAPGSAAQELAAAVAGLPDTTVAENGDPTAQSANTSIITTPFDAPPSTSGSVTLEANLADDGAGDDAEVVANTLEEKPVAEEPATAKPTVNASVLSAEDVSADSLNEQQVAALAVEKTRQENGVFQPPSKPTLPSHSASSQSGDSRVFTSQLKTAIDNGEARTVVALLGDVPAGFALDDAKYAVEDSFGSGVRTALEQAAYNGEERIVRLLADDGASIPPRLLHRIVENADRPEMASMLGLLLEEGADPNGMLDGLTPLMRAALKGDPETAYMLLAFGARPDLVSTDGRIASDFARQAGRADLEERLVLASSEPQYRELMMGLSWSDTLASVHDRVEVCKDIGDDFTACKLRIDSWLEDAKVIVAQFDRKASNRLVAIQIDSRPLSSVPSAVARFEAARAAIQARVPQGHAGFVTTEVQNSETLFRDLRPEVNRGRYFSYWPDQDRHRPVFIHLKLTGLDDQHGFYRIVIGNPFRAG